MMADADADRGGGPLGIVAGRGDLPRRLIDACRARGRAVFVIAITDQTPPETVADVPHAWVRLGSAASVGFDALRRAGVREVVMAGGLRRPSVVGMIPDPRTALFLAKTGALSLGDDGLLRAVVGEMEAQGFRVVGAHEILPELLAPPGTVGRVTPDAAAREDIRVGVLAAKALGARDVGQAVVVRGGVVIAEEDTDGTDALLDRLPRGDGGVLVKVCKPGQEVRADLPAIGPETVAGAAVAGLSGIAVEAGRSLVLARERTVDAADMAGLFIAGVTETGEDTGAAASGPMIFLVAGEPSGDLLGARLMQALKAETGGTARFSGVGGPNMEAEGLVSLFPMAELSIMGLVEVLPRLPRLLRRIRQTVAAAKAYAPDAVVTIDSPGFTFRVARRLHEQNFGAPLIHYVAPTVWAWKPKRAKKVARFLDHLMVLLPFEPPYFEREGLPTTFVGHPVVERGADKGDGARFRARHAIAADAPLLCVLPGSRRGETERLLPVFADTVAGLAARHPNLRCVVPTVETVAEQVRDAVAAWPTPVVVVAGEAEKFDAFAAADAALAASGTVALELAAARTPTVIAYKLNGLTAWLIRRMIKVRFANLVNILLDEEVVPERLQEACRADTLVADVDRLLTDKAAALRQIERADEALAMLGRGGTAPGVRAARAVLDVIREEKRKA